MGVFLRFGAGQRGRIDRRGDVCFGNRLPGRRFGCHRLMVIVVMAMIVIMGMIVLMSLMVMMARVGVRVLAVGFGGVEAFRVFLRMFLRRIGLRRLRRIATGILDNVALDAVAMAAPVRVAMTRATAAAAVAGAVLAFFLGFAMGAFVGLDQRLTVGDRDLVVVGMDFAEGQEAVAVAAIFDESRLQRWLYARDLGEVDIAPQLFALGGLEIKFFDAIAADHNDPGLFRVGGIDQHLVGHFGALDGGGRGAWRAQIARPGDATVHLIRG
ncbi:hypothetical protein [Bradyrhizobium lablabi]|uniref:hypothetical protein n=2 Tax=Bradyrhizobium TaxID=374 RepID=UPI003D9AD272